MKVATRNSKERPEPHSPTETRNSISSNPEAAQPLPSSNTMGGSRGHDEARKRTRDEAVAKAKAALGGSTLLG